MIEKPAAQTFICENAGGCASLRFGPCSGLEPSARRHIANGSQRARLTPGQTLWEEGDEPMYVAVVLDGVLRMEQFDIEGTRRVLGFVLPGEIAGLAMTETCTCSVVASVESEICKIDRRRFSRMLESDPDLMRALARQVETRLERLRWNTWSLGALSAGERVAGFLAAGTRIMPYQPLPDGTGVLTLHLPRPDIADYLGTTVETISRVTQRLDREGLIEILDPRHFRIVDLAALAQRGGVEGILGTLPFPPLGELIVAA